MKALRHLPAAALDLETALRITAGPDVLESVGLQLDLPLLDKPNAQLRIAVWVDDPFCPVSSAVRDRVQAVARALAAEGAMVDDQARPKLSAEPSHQVFQGLLHSAMSARLPDDVLAKLVAQADALNDGDQGAGAQMLRAQIMRARLAAPERGAHQDPLGFAFMPPPMA